MDDLPLFCEMPVLTLGATFLYICLALFEEPLTVLSDSFVYNIPPCDLCVIKP